MTFPRIDQKSLALSAFCKSMGDVLSYLNMMLSVSLAAILLELVALNSMRRGSVLVAPRKSVPRHRIVGSMIAVWLPPLCIFKLIDASVGFSPRFVPSVYTGFVIIAS